MQTTRIYTVSSQKYIEVCVTLSPFPICEWYFVFFIFYFVSPSPSSPAGLMYNPPEN